MSQNVFTSPNVAFTSFSRIPLDSFKIAYTDPKHFTVTRQGTCNGTTKGRVDIEVSGDLITITPSDIDKYKLARTHPLKHVHSPQLASRFHDLCATFQTREAEKPASPLKGVLDEPSVVALESLVNRTVAQYLASDSKGARR